MSMIGNFVELSPKDLDRLIANPSAVVDFIYPEEEQRENSIDIDKSWHAIHFTLTGSAWEGEPPLANLVLGGVEVGDDVGYGPARYLTADQVKEVVEAIKVIGAQEFAHRFNRQKLLANDIYPDIWDDSEETDEEQLDYLLTWYQQLATYYATAARKGNAMLKFLN